MDISKLVELVIKGTKPATLLLLSLLITTIIIIFVEIEIFKSLTDKLFSEWKAKDYFVFLIIFLSTYFVLLIIYSLNDKIKDLFVRRKDKSQEERRIKEECHKFSFEAKVFLNRFIDSESISLQLNRWDIDKSAELLRRDLISKGIIFKDPRYEAVYEMCPFAWKYLNKNKHLLKES